MHSKMRFGTTKKSLQTMKRSASLIDLGCNSHWYDVFTLCDDWILKTCYKASEMLYTPTHVCQMSGCTRYRAEQNICMLTEPVSYKATLFTLWSGVLPVFAVSYYCRGEFQMVSCNVLLMFKVVCHHQYYLNYQVHKASSERVYYGGVPEIIQVAQHFFFESALLEFFAINQLFTW